MGSGLEASILVALVAACENPQPPTTCGAIPQVTVNAGETSVVTACFNDPNGDMLTYSATSSNSAVATVSISGTTITVSALAPGNASVTVTATDVGGLQGQLSFQVMVPNRAPLPRGTIPSITVPAGETGIVDASSYFTEPDGEALAYGAVSSDPAVATVSVTGSTILITGVAKGRTTVAVMATDPGGLSATQTFQATVPNRPPAPVGTIPDETVEAGEAVTVDLSPYFEDPDGDALRYTASSSAPGVVRTSVAGGILTVTGVAKGTTNVTVTAADSEGLSATQTFQATVPNRPPAPVGTIPDETVEAGEAVTVDLSPYFEDPDGDALRYTASSTDSGVVRVSVGSGILTIRAVAKGTTDVTVTAADSEGLSATQTFQATVPNRPPAPVGAIPDETVEVGEAVTVNASQYFTDPDGDALAYTARSSNTSAARVSVSGSTVTITAVATGSATITITARDPDGLSAAQWTTVTVVATAAPDLEFTNVTPRSVTVAPGETFTVSFRIRNSGDGASAATTMRFYESVNSTISTADREIGTLPFGALASGISRTVAVDVTVSGSASGTFYGGSCVDPVSGESDTSNNCSPSVRVTVTSSGSPDLEFTNVTPRSVVVSAGSSFLVTFTIENSGDAESAATTIRYYQSTDANISTNDRQIASVPFPSLVPGDSRRAIFTLTVPYNAASQATYIGSCLDPVPGESDRSNNCSPSVRVRIVSSSNVESAASGSATIEGEAELIVPASKATSGGQVKGVRIRTMIDDSKAGQW